MRLPTLIFALSALASGAGSALVVADSEEAPSHPKLTALANQLNTRAVVRLHTPYGVQASGVLLKGGTHILTAAHVATCLRPELTHKGLVVFANAESQQRNWLSVQFHPKATDQRLKKVWDVALIELSQPVPDNEVEGFEIAQKELNEGTLIALTGYGAQGNGVQGDFRKSSTFALGFNHLDFRMRASQCESLRMPVGNWPLWVHRFDSDSALGKLEAHFASGDSGGAGLTLTTEGQTKLATLNIARYRGAEDRDHRLNGSFGELGISIEAHALLPWIKNTIPEFSKNSSK